MRLQFPTGFDEGLLSASTQELARVADAVAEGEGFVSTTGRPDGKAVLEVEARTTADAGVRLDLDRARRILVITGGLETRGILADNLRAVATVESGGHLHIDYFPDHPYLCAGSVSLVVDSPHE